MSKPEIDLTIQVDGWLVEYQKLLQADPKLKGKLAITDKDVPVMIARRQSEQRKELNPIAQALKKAGL